MTHAVQLLRCRQSRRPGADYRYFLPGAPARRFRNDPAFLERPIRNALLDDFDCDGFVIDS